MKTRIIGTLVLLLSLCVNLAAQEAKIEWSEKFEMNGKDRGFLDKIVGEKGDLLFVAYSHQPSYAAFTTQSKEKKFHYRLVSYDKNTLRELNHVDVRKGGADKAHKGLWLFQTVVMNDRVIVFWKSLKDNSEELFAEVFDLQLNRIQELKSIFKSGTPDGAYKPFPIFVVSNRNASNKIIVGYEYPVGMDFMLHIDYKILNEDFSVSGGNTVSLGFSFISVFEKPTLEQKMGPKKDKFAATVLEYTLLDDNTLMFSNLTVLNLNTNETTAYKLQDVGFTYENLSFVQTPYGLRLAGFYKDESKAGYLNKLHGFFIATINSEQRKLEVSRHEFTKEFLSDVYKTASTEDMSDRKKEKEEKNAQYALNSLVIEQIEEGPDGYVIFCSLIENDLRTTPATANYSMVGEHCTKRNVYALAVDSDFKYKWHATVIRTKSYGAWDVHDIKVAPIENGYFVTFGDDTNEAADENSKDKQKSLEERRDLTEYALIYTNGDVLKKTMVINDENTSKENRKYISPTRAYTRFGNDLYIYSYNLKTRKITFIPLAIVTVGSIANRLSKFKHGHTEIGRLTVK